MTEEVVETNANLLKAAKYATYAMLALVLGQSMTGVGNFTTELELASSHKYSSYLGLGLSILTVAAIMMSKTDDSKLKGFGFEAATMWVIMYGLGEMSASGMHHLSMLHAPIGVLMFMRLWMMVKAFPSE